MHPDDLGLSEDRFPLEVAFCESCSLVQILEEVPADTLFADDYPYFSSFSEALVEHSRLHAEQLIVDRNLGSESLVVELASNDGYLLGTFVSEGIPVLGIDPAPEQAAAAEEKGVPTITEFFSADVAQRLRSQGHVANVIIANNVLAHVPELNDFVEGMSILLADDGLITVENPYVRELIDQCEFDTIYHEHYCYYSCTSIDNLMRRHDLFLNDVEFFPDLHGGTLRWHIGRTDRRTERARAYLDQEREIGLDRFEYFASFAQRVATAREDLISLLEELRATGATVAGYGAAAKGSTLLNYAHIDTGMVSFVVDRNDHKQGLFMPGTHQPIVAPEALLERHPDYVLLLAWNFADEIIAQQQDYIANGGRFILPVPTAEVLHG